MVQVEHLSFEYPGQRALDDVSFSVVPGSITALVGPNGAGKTTLLRCMAGLLPPLDGRVLVDGLEVAEHPREVHRRIGYLSDFFGLYESMTVAQCLFYAADSQQVDEALLAERVRQTAVDVGLADRLDARAGELSRGLRQRLAIGQAIIHSPKLLLLDEPASGLDPEARHALSELLKSLCARGMTLMVSSHILAELEEYCTEMLIVRAGKVMEQRAVNEARRAEAHVRIRLAAPVPDLRARLDAYASIRVIDADESSALIATATDPRARHELLGRLLADGLPVCAFAEEEVNLQDAYLATVRAADRGESS
jgi:ABC-2 type transport system ATP-binding protein